MSKDDSAFEDVDRVGHALKGIELPKQLPGTTTPIAPADLRAAVERYYESNDLSAAERNYESDI